MSSEPSFASNPQQPAPAPEETFWSNLKNLGYCLFCLIGGVVLLVWQGVSRAEATASLKWPTAEGRITASEVVQQMRVRRKRVREEYEPKITYSYQVNGTSYTGVRIDYFGEHSSANEQQAATICSKYSVGQDVKVCYNPQEPGTSLLEPGMTGNNSIFSWCMIGLGGFLALIGLFGSVGNGYQLIGPGRSANA